MICLAQMESIFAPFHQSYTGDSGSKLGVCAEKEGRAKEEMIKINKSIFKEHIYTNVKLVPISVL